MPQGSLSAIPWRKLGLKYSSNDFYMDIIESIDAIIDSCVAPSHSPRGRTREGGRGKGSHR